MWSDNANPNLLPYEVDIHLYMFRALMKHKVGSKHDGKFVVAEQSRRVWHWKPKFWSQISSHVPYAIARYLASAEDVETMACFLLFQDMR